MPNHPRYHLKGTTFCEGCNEPISYKNKSGICKTCKTADPKMWKRYKGRKVRLHIWAFLTAYGDGPHICSYCGYEISGDLNVHHKDEDQSNNDPKNLVPMHRNCHLKLHHETRDYTGLSNGMKRYWQEVRS